MTEMLSSLPALYASPASLRAAAFSSPSGVSKTERTYAGEAVQS